MPISYECLRLLFKLAVMGLTRVVNALVYETVSVFALVNPKRFFLIGKTGFDRNCSVQLTHLQGFVSIWLAYTSLLIMSTRKGVKGLKNVPIFYDEIKERHTVVLTPTAWTKLKIMAHARGISVSEIIEEWVRETPD